MGIDMPVCIGWRKAECVGGPGGPYAEPGPHMLRPAMDGSRPSKEFGAGGYGYVVDCLSDDMDA